jgi:PAS domain S-box-containing protein
MQGAKRTKENIMRAMASPRRKSEPVNIHLLVDSIPAMIHTSMPDGYLDYFNKPWLEYLGVTLDKMAGWNWTSFIHPEDVDGIVAKWRACLATGEIFEYESRVRRANGEYRWMYHCKVPLRDADGNIVKWYGSSLDIDERKTAEQQLHRNAKELQRSQFYLAEGQRLGHMGSWAFNPDGFDYWSPELFRMHGLDPANKPPSLQEYLDYLHPHDRESMADLIKGILAEAAPFDATKRIVRPDGEVRYIRCVGAPNLENERLKKYVGSAIDVTEHELLTQELRRREAYLTEAQRLSQTGSFGCNVPTGEMYWSEETFRIYGYDRSTQPAVERVLERVHPEERVFVRERMDQANRDVKDCDVECRLLMPDGSVKHVCIVAHASKNESGATEFIGAVTDVTARRGAEEALRSSEADLLEAQRLSHTGSWRHDVLTGIVTISPEVQRIFDIRPGEGAPTAELFFGRIHPEDRPIEAQNYERANLEKTDFESDYRIVLPDGSIKHVHNIGHPVLSESGEIREFVGTVIDITERKVAGEAIRRSEAYLAEAQRLSHTGSWAWNVRTDALFWSEEIFRIYGYNPQETVPTWEQFLQRVHPNDRSRIKQRAEMEATGNEWIDSYGDFRIVLADGTIKYLHSVAHPVTESGKVTEVIGTVMDVTQQELLTQELQRREAYLAEAQKLSHTGSFGWKPDTGEIVWSDETYRIFEYDRSVKPTIDSPVQRVHPEDSAVVKEVINLASAGATEFEHAYRLLMPDGRVKHVHAIAHVLQDASGNREFVGAVTDITAAKRTVETLRESEAYLAEAQRLSQTGSWAWDPATTKATYMSEECYRILGLDPQDGMLSLETAFQHIHPDDRQTFAEKVERFTHERAEFELDYRFRHPGGEFRDIHQVGHPVLSPSGDLVEFVGTLIDVTERKRAEDKIREQEAELRQMLDLAPQHVRVYGPGGERLYANRIALDYYGVTFEEWRQTSGNAFRSSLFVHPDDQERVAREFDANRSSGSAYESEVRVRGADGNYRWFLVRYNPLHDDKGQVKRWYLALTDIEDRKQAEDRLRQENVALREEIDKASMFEEIVGTSRPLTAVLSRIAKVAPTDSTVLITGETGTGKELIARAIHRRSRRSSRAFVSVNCAAIPRDLIASEFFGHEKGAFTGALQRRVGKFELAEGGTIFLDEVGELPTETQIALLRVLQEREFDRVGGIHPIRADVRVIAATNRDLEASIAAGTFREDLFYRINVFPIEIPPLRQRKDDIPMLVEYFIDRYARKAGKKIKSIDKNTLELLRSYSWPGNIRELQNIIERSVIVCETETFSVDQSWLSVQSSPPQPERAPLALKSTAQDKHAIEAALTQTQGRVSGPSGAAALLGVPASTLESKIRALRINKFRFKSV